MKNLFLAALAGLMFSTSAMAIDECFTGSWYDAEANDGRGLDFQVLANEQIAGYFYTWYGAERDLFLVAGSSEGGGDNLWLSGYQSFYGGEMYAGTATISVVDNDTILFTHTWKYDARNTDSTMRWCLNSTCTGEYEFTRLTQPIPCE